VEPASARSRLLGAHYDSGWARKLPARYARFFLTEGVDAPVIAGLAQPERRGLDRLADLDGPAIFAANHHSHLDAGLLITSLPEPHRHQVFAGAAADYFFDTRVKATASALVLNAIPIERTKVGPPFRRRSGRTARRRLEHGDLPRGRPVPRRLGPALPRRRRLPGDPVRRARSCRCTWPAPGASCPRARTDPKPGRTVVTFGTADARPPRASGPRRFAERLERPWPPWPTRPPDWYSARKPRRRRRDTGAGTAHRGRVAQGLGPQRPAQAPPHPPPRPGPTSPDPEPGEPRPPGRPELLRIECSVGGSPVDGTVARVVGDRGGLWNVVGSRASRVWSVSRIGVPRHHQHPAHARRRGRRARVKNDPASSSRARTGPPWPRRPGSTGSGATRPPGLVHVGAAEHHTVGADHLRASGSVTSTVGQGGGTSFGLLATGAATSDSASPAVQHGRLVGCRRRSPAPCAVQAPHGELADRASR
jgi:hypothetical protein